MISVLRVPGVLALFVTSCVARLPMGALGLLLILHTEELSGSYAQGGVAAGAYMLALGVSNPLLGRVVDRRGQTLVLRTGAPIAAQVRDQLGAVSTQAVYDGLRALTAVGLLRRIEPAGSPARYETRVGDNHHHVVCRVCGATRDIDCVAGTAPCLDPSETGGFAIDEAEVTFWGLCPDCHTTTKEETTR